MKILKVEGVQILAIVNLKLTISPIDVQINHQRELGVILESSIVGVAHRLIS